jgi:hypothetical protein
MAMAAVSFVLVLAALALLKSFSFARAFFRARKRNRDASERCRCGYLMQGLTALRCPECGRVPGFDATAEELKLTNAELERAMTVKEHRRAADSRLP